MEKPIWKQLKKHLNKVNEPLISICIPTYNGAPFIEEAMDSAITQTYENLEIIVSDDASTDNTLKIIETYKTKTNIPIHIHRHQPNGIGANWNHCIIEAHGAFIKFLFQDDVMLPNCLEEMMNVFQQYPKVAMVVSKRDFLIETHMKTDQINQWVTTYGDLQAHMHLPEEDINILDKSIFMLPTFYASPYNKIGEPSVVMFRKKLIDDVGYFDEELKQILDYEYWYRIIKKHSVAIINKPLVKFRLHQNQATNLNKNTKIIDYEIYEKILYTDFLSLLHPKLRIELKTKYNKQYRFYVNFKKKIKKLIS